MVRKNHHTEAHTDVTERLPHELPTTPKISTAAASHQLNGSTKFLEQSRCIPTARPNSSINRQMPLSNRVAILIDHWRRDIHMQYSADKQHIPALCLSQWVHKHFQVCKTGPWRKNKTTVQHRWLFKQYWLQFRFQWTIDSTVHNTMPSKCVNCDVIFSLRQWQTAL